MNFGAMIPVVPPTPPSEKLQRPSLPHWAYGAPSSTRIVLVVTDVGGVLGVDVLGLGVGSPMVPPARVFSNPRRSVFVYSTSSCGMTRAAPALNPALSVHFAPLV